MSRVLLHQFIRNILYLMVVILPGCIKEEVGHTQTFIKNITNHTIKLLPFSGGAIDGGMTRVIPALSNIEVFSANVRGKTLDPSFGTLLNPYDSVLVVYDDTVKIPHIKFNLVYTGTHRVLHSSNRSISNEANYDKQITKETKYSLRGSFTFTFIEQDYLDAK